MAMMHYTRDELDRTIIHSSEYLAFVIKGHTSNKEEVRVRTDAECYEKIIKSRSKTPEEMFTLLTGQDVHRYRINLSHQIASMYFDMDNCTLRAIALDPYSMPGWP